MYWGMKFLTDTKVTPVMRGLIPGDALGIIKGWLIRYYSSPIRVDVVGPSVGDLGRVGFACGGRNTKCK